MWKAPLIGLVAFYLGCGGTVPAQTAPSTPPPRDASNGCSVERPCPAAPAQGWGPSHCYGAGDIRPCGARGCVEMQRRCDARSDGAPACPEGLVCDQGTCIARPCTQTDECGSPNLACRDAVCVHRACTKSRDCGAGTCIHGECYAAPGTCSYPPETPLP